MFEHLQQTAPDPILGLMQACRSDPRPDKVDLGVGVFQDELGRTPVMRAVQAAESRLLAGQTTKTYIGIAGDAAFNEQVLHLALGVAHPVIAADRVRAVQTPGGCGALRIGAELLRRARSDVRVWVSTPTWPNHVPLIGGAGLQLEEYPYFDLATGGVDFDAMMGALAKVPAGDVVLLHASCHNPTGADLAPAQWDAVAALAARNGFVPFIDSAYQGLADGLEADAYGLRAVVAAVPEALFAVSCSKNFGLYRERAGGVYIVAGTPSAADAALSQAMISARQIYSMPPAHGAAIVATILADAGLRADWELELADVRGRILAMRELLASRLEGNSAGKDFGFIRRQKGMFSYLGVTPRQVTRLREEFAVYMMDSTRINVAGITAANIDALARALHAVLAE